MFLVRAMSGSAAPRLPGRGMGLLAGSDGVVSAQRLHQRCAGADRRGTAGFIGISSFGRRSRIILTGGCRRRSTTGHSP